MLQPIKNWLVKNAVLLSIVFTILVAIASLVKPTSFPKTGVSFSDKIAHTAIYFILTILYSIYKISCLHRKFKMDLLSNIPFELWDDILKYISDPETTLEKITQMYNNNPYVSISKLNYINQVLSSDNTKLWKHYL